jgi:hypothetical protein
MGAARERNQGCFAGAKMSLEKDKEKDDRRGADRFPIEREVRYRVLTRKTSV